jgi:ketosteroid isomerase-like protein
MRVMGWACCALVCLGGTARSADDATAIRESSAKYTEAILKRDKAALQGTLHKEYHGHKLLGGRLDDKATTATAVAHWTDPQNRFAILETTVEKVQVIGDTAIETGTVSGSCGDRNAAHIFQNVTYTRVWVKDKTGWHLAHERY